MTVETGLPAPAPYINPEVKPFWDATAEGRLVVPRCDECQTLIWFPRPFCPACLSTAVTWVEVSGRGTVYSFTVNRRGAADLPDYRNAGVYVLAYVELEEGPRMMTNIVDCDLDSIKCGQKVKVSFKKTENGASVPVFVPA